MPYQLKQEISVRKAEIDPQANVHFLRRGMQSLVDRMYQVLFQF